MVTLLIMHFSAACCYFLPIGLKNLPQSYVRGYHGTLGRVFVKYSYRYLNPSLLYMMIRPL